MANWHEKGEKAANERRQEDHKAHLETWQAQLKEVQDAHREALAAWRQPIKDDDGKPIPKGPPPEPQPMPPPPSPPEPPRVFVSSEIPQPTVVQTLAGEALLFPPTVLMTAPDGSVFGVSPQDLAHGWTEA